MHQSGVRSKSQTGRLISQHWRHWDKFLSSKRLRVGQRSYQERPPEERRWLKPWLKKPCSARSRGRGVWLQFASFIAKVGCIYRILDVVSLLSWTKMLLVCIGSSPNTWDQNAWHLVRSHLRSKGRLNKPQEKTPTFEVVMTRRCRLVRHR